MSQISLDFIDRIPTLGLRNPIFGAQLAGEPELPSVAVWAGLSSPLAKTSMPIAAEPTTTHNAVNAIVNPPSPSASQPVMAGQAMPENEKKVTMYPVATPVRLGNRSAQIE